MRVKISTRASRPFVDILPRRTYFHRKAFNLRRVRGGFRTSRRFCYTSFASLLIVYFFDSSACPARTSPLATRCIYICVYVCASPPFLVLLLPAGRNLARPGYEIFSQFFLDRPAFPRFLSRRSVLRGKRTLSSLNGFTMCYTEAPSLQRTYIWMRTSQEGCLGRNSFKDQRPRKLEPPRTKYTWFYVNPSIRKPAPSNATGFNIPGFSGFGETGPTISRNWKINKFQIENFF